MTSTWTGAVEMRADVRMLEEIPPLPQNSQRLLDVISDEDVCLEDVARAIEEVERAGLAVPGARARRARELLRERPARCPARALWIVGFNEAEVTLDFNHPLAGQRCLYEVTVTGLRAARPEELAQGEPGAA